MNVELVLCQVVVANADTQKGCDHEAPKIFMGRICDQYGSCVKVNDSNNWLSSHCNDCGDTHTISMDFSWTNFSKVEVFYHKEEDTNGNEATKGPVTGTVTGPMHEQRSANMYGNRHWEG